MENNWDIWRTTGIIEHDEHDGTLIEMLEQLVKAIEMLEHIDRKLYKLAIDRLLQEYHSLDSIAFQRGIKSEYVPKLAFPSLHK